MHCEGRMMKEKLKKIKAVVMDVDGVLTNGHIVYDSAGREIKQFDVQDGYGIVLCRKAGLKTAIITARESKPVAIRALDLKIDKTYQNAYPKLNVYRRMLVDLKVKDSEVCYIGDDIPDLHVIRKAGFGVAVRNAVAEVKRAADYVTKKEGGRGAVREVIEMILKTQKKWKKVLPEG